MKRVVSSLSAPVLAVLLTAAGPRPEDAGTTPSASESHSDVDGSPIEGVDGLCALVVADVLPRLNGATTLALDIAAEGPAADLGPAIASRCERRFAAVGVSTSAPDGTVRPLRVRARANATSLLALVELFESAGSTATTFVANLEAASGRGLTSFIASTGRGYETWQQGIVPGRVLGLCGASIDGAGTARVALVTTDSIRFVKWAPGRLTPITRVELPEALRPRARAPGATVACRVEDGWLQVTFAIHDRARSGLVMLSRDGEPNLVENGPDEPWPFPGPKYTPVAGTGLVKDDAGKPVVTVVARMAGTTPPVAVTQDGLALLGAVSLASGEGVTLVDVDRDGTPELARTLPMAAGGNADDRVLVSRLDAPEVTTYESSSSDEPFSALGPVDLGSHAIVVAVRPGRDDSALVGVGLRVTTGAVQ